MPSWRSISLMGFREFNERTTRWAGTHPVKYFLLSAAVFGLWQMAMVVWMDRRFSWASFIFWTVVFPTFTTAMSVARNARYGERDLSKSSK